MIEIIKSFLLLLLISTIVSASEISLGTVSVTAEYEEEVLTDRTTKKVTNLVKQTKGETLGDYLEDEQFVDSASYGPAVGRPVVKGMDGYRVGISNGNIALNDLSAMSQDHAVGVMAKASQKIEMIKGPSSLLYGNYSGGVIHVLGEEHEDKLIKKGYYLDLSAEYGTNGAGYNGGTVVKISDKNISLYANSFYIKSENYKDGQNNVVKDSDTESLQSHIVLGYKFDKKNVVKFYADRLKKDYGISNSTDERTSIDMQQQTYGVVLHNKELFDGIERFQTELRYSDYLHYEYEATSADGLFGQKQLGLSTYVDFVTDDWAFELHGQYLNSELKVCHEHGKCTSFYKASRSDEIDGFELTEYYNTTGLAYSHGHPMPNISESTSQIGLNATTYTDNDIEFTTTIRLENRIINPDSSNMQEGWLVPDSLDANYYDLVNDIAISLSTGLTGYLNDELSYQTSISYIERLPSASEMFWNGFHHATNTYIFGDRYLDSEESINLDLTLMYEMDSLISTFSWFYYKFNNYIFQEPLADAGGSIVSDDFGHDADIWVMKGVGAKVYGIALQERFNTKYKSHEVFSKLSFEAIRGVLDDGGYIPRMSPFSATLEIGDKYKKLATTLKYKYVDKSRFEAVNETSTPAYSWLSLYLDYSDKFKYGKYSIYFKGENLTNAQAFNHLSFLKQTAPLPGRQLKLGATINF
jgi:iron complex outermembrane receptor protein